MSDSFKIAILFAEMALEFGQLNIAHGQWIKSKINGTAREETFDVDQKAQEIIIKYVMEKCDEQKLSKRKFLDECMCMDLGHMPIYRELQKLDDVTQDDIRLIAAEVINELPSAGVNELLSATMKKSKGTVDARKARAAIIRTLSMEKEALLQTVQKMSTADARMEIKLNQLLISLENKIQQIEERIKK